MLIWREEGKINEEKISEKQKQKTKKIESGEKGGGVQKEKIEVKKKGQNWRYKGRRKETRVKGIRERSDSQADIVTMSPRAWARPKNTLLETEQLE